MEKKCPKCGYELEEFDIFCARCGEKITQDDSSNDDLMNLLQNSKKNISNSKKNTNGKNSQNESLNESMDLFINDAKTKKQEYFNANAKNTLNNPLIGYMIFIVILCITFALSLNIFLSKQQEGKLRLQYKNKISRPQLIPELKEPENYHSLAQNLIEVEDFLALYLKYSTDDKEKKEKIFTNYLDEINKISHITSENLSDDEITECNKIVSSMQAKNCALKLNKIFKNSTIKAYNNQNIVYLYPNNIEVSKKYSKFLNDDLKSYLKLKQKYSKPTALALTLKIPPKQLADKIFDWETMMNKTTNPYIKETAQEIIYNDFRKFIFTPSIYATTTQEMRKDFKKAYHYYITTKKRKSNLAPVVMSYLDKQKNYTEENFKKDYPYKLFEKTFEEALEETALSDIFAQLRNNIISKASNTQFKFVFNTVTNKWSQYNKSITLKPVEFVLSDIDETNSISIYNNTMSLFQELNVSKYSKLFSVNSRLYIYNSDRLTISKINFNSENFSISMLSTNDVTSIFPGVNVISIDNHPNYSIYLEKDNTSASFIILSKYSQGWEKYTLEPIRGSFNQMILPNMFSVASLNDVEIAFRAKDVSESETSESAPTYKLTVHTKGQKAAPSVYPEEDIVQYDERTNREEEHTEPHNPIFKPKINQNKNDDDLLNSAPEQKLEPPEED